MGLKEKRLALGYSQIDMAAKVGVSINTYIQWERGVMKPNEENRKKLEEALEAKE